MVLRVKPTPTRFPTNSLYAPMYNTPLHSMSSVCHPWGRWSSAAFSQNISTLADRYNPSCFRCCCCCYYCWCCYRHHFWGWWGRWKLGPGIADNLLSTRLSHLTCLKLVISSTASEPMSQSWVPNTSIPNHCVQCHVLCYNQILKHPGIIC